MMISTLPDTDLAGFSHASSGSHDGVHILPEALAPADCAALVAAFGRHRHLAPTFQAPHEHFSGRTLWVNRLDGEAATIAAAASARLAVQIRQLFAELAPIVDDTPQVSVWPAPHGMYWHQDSDPPHRAYTALVYLAASPDLEGGETGFRERRILVPPVPGTAVLFETSQWHGVRDVRRGCRYAMTCWYRKAMCDSAQPGANSPGAAGAR